MYRIILFLLGIALAAWGAAWVADQGGDVTLAWSGWQVTATLPVFVLGFGLAIVAAMIAWNILRALWRLPERMRKARRERRHARGRHAITHGLLAIGHGDQAAARAHAAVARRHAASDPLTLLLHAQSAQLEGNRDAARDAFTAMAGRDDTRLLGLRGLFIEAQRADDAVAAVAIAQEALKLAPSSTWASQAVLGFRCARGDWMGALAILDNNLAAGLIDRETYRRQRGVLLTARALELETVDRDMSRDVVMEAVKLAPTLVPAAVLAAKYQSEAHQIRRAMRLIETAWLKHPHPDLADAYAHVRLGDSARQRLVRVETLAAKAPGHLESAVAVARAAIDASEFVKARAALLPFIEAPTQRVAMLMAEIERTEHGDSGKARAWTLRAVRAAHDPVWTADGYVSEKWRPVSPVTGRLDAFRWQAPLAALPSDQHRAADTSPFEQAMLSARPPPRIEEAGEPIAAQDNAPAAMPVVEAKPAPPVASPVPPQASPATVTVPPPVFRPRADLAKANDKGGEKQVAPIPTVIPIVRPPDDPGVDDEEETDEFASQLPGAPSQPGGWRGFLSRMRG